jgi:hypothetical protein
MHTATPPVAPATAAGRPLLWLGVGLFPLSRVIKLAILFGAGLLRTPWYSPALVTAGAGLIALSLVRRLAAWRAVALLLVGLLAAGEWWLLLAYSRVPAYAGPASAGQPFPGFSPASLANGAPFTRGDLVGTKDTVLVFYRGHW